MDDKEQGKRNTSLMVQTDSSHQERPGLRENPRTQLKLMLQRASLINSLGPGHPNTSICTLFHFQNMEQCITVAISPAGRAGNHSFCSLIHRREALALK